MKCNSMRKIVRWSVSIGIVLLFVGTSIAQVPNWNSSQNVVPKNLSKGTITFNPTDDSYCGAPNEVNGFIPFMYIRNGSVGDQWLAAPVIKFNISSIPANSLIISATLSIFYFTYSDHNPAGRALTVRHFEEDWEEETITRNNMPPYSSEISAVTAAPPSPGVWITWDVTSDVQKFVSGTLENYGWIIKDEQYWGGSGIPDMILYAKEHGSDIPYLEVKVAVLQSAVLVGRVTNLVSHDSYYTLDAVKLRYIQFSPFSFNTYKSGETIAVTKQMGILTTNFAFGLFKATLM